MKHWSHFITLDLIQNVHRFWRVNAGNNSRTWALLVSACALQALFEYVPFVSWFTWPFVVYVCVHSVREISKGSLSTAAQWRSLVEQLKANGEIVIALLLYGALSLIIFRGLLQVLSTAELENNYLPSSVRALMPFTFAQTCATLFIATCATRFNADDRDPFSILSSSLKELFLSPASTLLIILGQAAVWTYVAMEIVFYFKWPDLATFIGHAPFTLFLLIWVCGHSLDKFDKTWIESLKGMNADD